MMADWKLQHVRIDEFAIAVGDPQKVIDPVWWMANFYESPEVYEKSLRTFSRPQKLIWAMLWYVSEVLNGGHDQFYSNSTGMVWRDALDGFELLGVSEIATLLFESVMRMGGAPALDKTERSQQLEDINPSFDDIDDQFYEIESTGKIDLDAIMMEYIRANAKDFYFEGMVNKPVR